MKRKALNIILTLSLLLSFIVPVNSDAALGVAHERELSVLNALGILSGYPDEAYDPEAAVTRDDFLETAYRLTGNEADSAETAASILGVAGGSSEMTVVEAVKAVVNAIGYGSLASLYGNNYPTIASMYGIADGIGSPADSADKVTNDKMVMLLWNALQCDALEETIGFNASIEFSDKTVMEENFDVYYDKTVVYANGWSYVRGYEGYQVSSREVLLNVENPAEGRDVLTTYMTGKTDAADFMGYEVEVYYTFGAAGMDDTVIWIEPASEDQAVTIYDDDLIEVSESSMTYSSSTGSRKNQRVDSDYIIVYKGASEPDMLLEDVVLGYGEIVAVDNDGDGRSEVIYVNDYDVLKVDSIVSSTNTIRDFEGGGSLDIDANNYDAIRVTQSGEAKLVSDITTGMVIAAMYPESKEVLVIRIFASTVSGSVTSVSGTGEVTVSGKVYKKSRAYVPYGGDISPGKSGTFYLDDLGRILRAELGRDAASQYGYIMRMYAESEYSTEFVVTMLTAEGTQEEFMINGSVNLNGKVQDSDKAYEELQNIRSVQYGSEGVQQLVTYSVSSENEISRITTPYVADGNDSVQAEFSRCYSGAGRYRRTTMSFASKYLIQADTPLFIIPYNERDYDNYSVRTAAYLTNDKSYNIKAFDIDEYMGVGAVVINEEEPRTEALVGKRSVILSEKPGIAVDEDGLNAVLIEGYQQGAKVSYMLSDSELGDSKSSGNVTKLSSLGPGDVIQVGTDTDGRVRNARIIMSDRRLFHSSSENENEYFTGHYDYPDLYVCIGEVTSRNDSLVIVKTMELNGAELKRPFQFVGGTSVYLLDGPYLSVASKDDIQQGDTVFVQFYKGNTHEIIIMRNQE